MFSKTVTLAYKSKPNLDGKTTYIEFVGITKNWKEREFFYAACKLTDYNPMLITIDKKRWRKVRKDKADLMKVYTDTMQELYDKAKNGI